MGGTRAFHREPWELAHVARSLGERAAPSLTKARRRGPKTTACGLLTYALAARARVSPEAVQRVSYDAHAISVRLASLPCCRRLLLNRRPCPFPRPSPPGN